MHDVHALGSIAYQQRLWVTHPRKLALTPRVTECIICRLRSVALCSMGKRKANPEDALEGEEKPKSTKKAPKPKKGHPMSDQPYVSSEDGWTIVPPALLHKYASHRDYRIKVSLSADCVRLAILAGRMRHVDAMLRKHGTSKSRKIAAFDLDDTLVKLKSTARFPTSAEDFKLFNKKVPQVLQDFAADGYRIVIFSNQGGVKAALEGPAAQKVRQRADNVIAQLDVAVHIFYATADEKSETDTFRKPRTGMWDMLVKQHLEGQSPDLNNSFFVGDAAGRPGDFADSDRKLAESIGIAFKTPEEVFGESDSKKAIKTDSSAENHNQAMSDAFRELAQLNESQGGNMFGVRALIKVADIIASFPKKIESSSDLKNVQGVGKASIAKVEEFLAEGKLHQLEEAGIKVDKPSAGESAAFKFL